MKRKSVLLLILVMTLSIIMSGCGNIAAIPEINGSELEKLPENYPLKSAPLYGMCEIVSVNNSGSEGFFSCEVKFNSTESFNDIVDYYTGFFSDPIVNDFGIAYSILSVPESSGGYLCNLTVYSSVTDGTEGVCTVIIAASDY